MLPSRLSKLAKVAMFLVAIVAIRATIFSLNLTSSQDQAASYDDVIKNYANGKRGEVGDAGESAVKTSYSDALRKAASPDKVVLLALIDWGFMDMALNFFESSLYPHNIENYLFLASDSKSCVLLEKVGVACHLYVTDESGAHASEYHSKAFLRKMNYRTQMIIEALELGYTVLHSDIDVIFLQNPFQHINCTSVNRCDIRALWDATKYNAGFIYLRPTKASLALYNTMRNISQKQPKMDDQIQMVHALEELQHGENNVSIDIARLPEELFQCGRCYFEDVPRAFAGDVPCGECVVVHNNWIVTKEAKRYRSREHLHWYHDWDGYYSKPTAKYLLYGNPVSDCTTYWDERETKQRELTALQNAMAYGKVLDRIVILPEFHCGDRPCALNSHLKIQEFDKAFEGEYREHSFLRHVKVPQCIKDDKSETFFVQGAKVEDWCVNSFADTVSVVRQDSLSDRDVKKRFGGVESPVLRFYSMHDTFDGFVSTKDAEWFKKLIEQGFVETDYRQQKPPPKQKPKQ